MTERNDRCGAIKNAAVTLRCILLAGHSDWHKAELTDHRELVYDGAHHIVHTTETVTWEPRDHVHEAVRHLMAARHRDDADPDAAPDPESESP